MVNWAPPEVRAELGGAPSCSPTLTAPQQVREAQLAAGEGLTLEPSHLITDSLTPRMLLSPYQREMITSYKKLMMLQDESQLSHCSPDVPVPSPRG